MNTRQSMQLTIGARVVLDGGMGGEVLDVSSRDFTVLCDDRQSETIAHNDTARLAHVERETEAQRSQWKQREDRAFAQHVALAESRTGTRMEARV